MEPIEINTGAWYLRALRADEWAADTGYSWAVCEPTTGEVLAEVTLDPRRATLASRARPGHVDAATAACDSVRRFAATLGLLQLVAEPGQGFGQQPGDVHLRDADPLGDLGLRQ
ncbi:MAG: hypothetical protein WCP30_07590 [Mycobacteriaceae bacterium]